MKADLSGYSLAELRALEEQARTKLLEREHWEIEDARNEILSIAKRIGVPIEVLVGGRRQVHDSAKSTKSAKAVKFRHPSNRSKEWTGRGRKPLWVREWLESGGYLDQLLV